MSQFVESSCNNNKIKYNNNSNLMLKLTDPTVGRPTTTTSMASSSSSPIKSVVTIPAANQIQSNENKLLITLLSSSSSNTSTSSSLTSSSGGDTPPSGLLASQSTSTTKTTISIDNNDTRSTSNSSSSSSSVIAALSIISFSSTSSSSSSLSSNLSSDEHNSVKQDSQHHGDDSNCITLSELNHLMASTYINKQFYGKEWLFRQLIHYVSNRTLLVERFDMNNLNKRKSMMVEPPIEIRVNHTAGPSCLVLLGDGGTGKTHLCCELMHSKQHIVQSYLRPHLVCVHFLSMFNKRQNSLTCLFNHMGRSLQELHHALQKSNKVARCMIKLKRDDYFLDEIDNNETVSSSVADCDGMTAKFIEDILKPLNQIAHVSKNYFILVDGLDDCMIQKERIVLMRQEHKTKEFSELVYENGPAIMKFLSKIFAHFPPWLNLILTARRSTEKAHLRVHLSNVKYEKLSMDKCYNLSVILSELKTTNMVMNASNSVNSLTDQSSTGLHSSSMHSDDAASSNSKNSAAIEVCNAAHFANLKDIQTYILKRLESDNLLKSRFNPTGGSGSKSNSVELINLLLIKSNYSVLYVEKIFDLITLELMSISEIASIPVTLNGLYLYLIEKILSSLSNDSAGQNVFLQTSLVEEIKQKRPQLDIKDLIYSIIGCVIIESRPFTKLSVYSKLACRFLTLDYQFFELIFDYLSPIFFCKWQLNKQPTTSYILFHSSLVDWFTDIKFSTEKYFNNLGESHLMLACYYFKRLNQAEQRDQRDQLMLKFHLFNSKIALVNTTTSFEELMKYVLKIYQPEGETKLKKSSETVAETAMNTGIESNEVSMDKMSSSLDDNSQLILLDLITQGDLRALKKYIKTDFFRLSRVLCQLVDSMNQTPLIIAAKLNNSSLVEYLVKFKGMNLDHECASGWTALRYSSWAGNEDIVKCLLENGASVDLSDSEGRTALRAAVFSGHEQIVKTLLRYNANANKCDKENRSSLHIAVLMGHTNLVNLLLLHGAQVNHQDSAGRSSLLSCFFSSTTSKKIQYEMMKILIKYGASPDLPDHTNKTCLILASQKNAIHVVDLLINNGADVDYVDTEAYTALTHAVVSKHEEMCELLLKRNAATHLLDLDGRSVLSLACKLGSDRILKLLMEKGLDEMHRDNQGRTPLHDASQHGHSTIVEMLLNYGSEIDAVDNDGKSSLYYACQEGHFDVIKLLAQRQANLNLRAHDGSSPLRVACLMNRFSICKYLLDKGADIDSTDLDGRTNLHYLIALNSNLDMIKFLIDCGASLNKKDNEGRTSVHAMVNGRSSDEMLNLLLDLNTTRVNLNESDNQGATALILACWNDKSSVVKFLLRNSSRLGSLNLNQTDNQGATALCVACQRGNYDIAHELLKSGALIQASPRNPIKIAMQAGHGEIVKLLQLFSARLYAQQQQIRSSKARNETPTSGGMPRNSISLDSIKLFNTSSSSSGQEWFERAVVQPNTASQRVSHSPSFQITSKYQRLASQRYPSSNASTPTGHLHTTEKDYINSFNSSNIYRNQSLIITNNNRSSDKHRMMTSENQTAVESSLYDTNLSYSRSVYEVSEASKKPSKLKQVRDKLFKKSSTNSVNLISVDKLNPKRSYSINIANDFNKQSDSQTPPTSGFSYRVNNLPGSSTTGSLASNGSIYNMMIRANLANSSRPMSQIHSEYSLDTITAGDDSTLVTDDDIDDDFSVLESPSKKSNKTKFSGNKLFKAIRRKIKLFKSSKNDLTGKSTVDVDSDFDFTSCSSSQSNYNIKPNETSRQIQRSMTDMLSDRRYSPQKTVNLLTTIQSVTSLNGSTQRLEQTDDASAHIFKRNSLHDCLNLRGGVGAYSYRDESGALSSSRPLGVNLAPPTKSTSYRVIGTIVEHATDSCEESAQQKQARPSGINQSNSNNHLIRLNNTPRPPYGKKETCI